MIYIYLTYYDPKQQSKHIIYANDLYGYAMSKFFSTSGLKRKDPKEFDLNECTSIFQKGVFLILILNIQTNYTEYKMVIL